MTARGVLVPRFALFLALSLTLWGLAACGGPPPPPPLPPTVVELTLTAASDANPSASGEGSPVMLRVYQLASSTAFNGAEFFPLFNGDADLLKSDLIKRDDLILSPGQTKTLTLMPKDDVTAIGVFAAYRDFQHAAWRGTAEVPPHQTTRVLVTASGHGVTVKADPAPAPPAKPGS
jgi:type VI secretion system protein VasD